jgi:hypothetical protein
MRRTACEVVAVLGRQALGEARRAGQELALGGVLGVEDAERVGAEPPPALLREGLPVGLEVAHQLGPVGRPALGAADGVEQHGEPREPELAQEVEEHQEKLAVRNRSGIAQELGADLEELPVAAPLRALVAELRPDVEEPDRRRPLLEPVLDVRPRHRGRRLRAQGDVAAALVDEAVHLLADDVGRLAHAADEELGLLEHRGADLAVAVAGEDAASGLVHRGPDRGLRRQEVAGALHPADALAHPTPR